MKKLIFLLFAFISINVFSQTATTAKQDVQIAEALAQGKTLDTTNTLARAIYARLAEVTASLAANTASLNLIKQKLDTADQGLRRANLLLTRTEGKLDSIITATKSNSVIGISTSSAQVGGFTAFSTSSLVLSVAGAYATGDYMGPTTTPASFTNCTRSSGGTATIKGIFINDKATNVNVDMEIWFFSATFTAPTDNAAWTCTDAENLTVLGVVPISASLWFTSGANQTYCDANVNLPIKPAVTTIFYALVARNTTPSQTSGNYNITITLFQD